MNALETEELSMDDAFKIEDVTSDEINQETLRGLNENNPSLVELCVLDGRRRFKGDGRGDYCAETGLEFMWLGRFIGRNAHLKELKFCCDVDAALCPGLNRNRSIEEISFCGFGNTPPFRLLMPFFKDNTCLSKIGVENGNLYDHGAKTFLSAIEGCNQSLKDVELYRSRMEDDDLCAVFEALKGHPQLKRLELGDMNVGVKLCREVSAFVRKCNLTELNLRSNPLDDQCVLDLVDALYKNGSLKILDLSYNSSSRAHPITKRGWESIAGFLSSANCNLEELNVEQCRIHNEDAEILAEAITAGSTLKKLGINRDNHITDQGWCNFGRILCHNHRMAEIWFINVNNIKGNLGAESAAVSSLILPSTSSELYQLRLSQRERMFRKEKDETILDKIHNDKVHVLDLGSNQQIGTQGWQSLPSLLQNSCPSLKKLSLRDCNIDDDGLKSLVHALFDSKLQVLDLTCNGCVSEKGWVCVASLIESNCELEKLYLNHNRISDEEARTYANALARNTSLSTLSLAHTDITRAGWDCFLNAVYNTSSVNNTFLSNHTLSNLGQDMSNRLQRVLALNDGSNNIRFFEQDRSNERFDEDGDFNDKAAVALIKIFNHHRQFDMRPFFEWELKVLPIAVKWFQRARSIDMEVDDDRYGDDSSVESVVDDYVLPLWDSPQEYISRVDRAKLNAIYQFIRGNAASFESISFALRRKRPHSLMSRNGTGPRVPISAETVTDLAARLNSISVEIEQLGPHFSSVALSVRGASAELRRRNGG